MGWAALDTATAPTNCFLRASPILAGVCSQTSTEMAFVVQRASVALQIWKRVVAEQERAVLGRGASRALLPESSFCELSCASVSSLLQTSVCSRVTLWWGPTVRECFRLQTEGFHSLRGNGHHAGCAPMC